MRSIIAVVLGILLAKSEVKDPQFVKNSENIVKEDTTICFIGDSRTVGMSIAAPEDDTVSYICECGMGYLWLTSEETQEQISKADADVYVFNLGVNDVANVLQYAKYVNSFSEERPDSVIIYMSVNPVDDLLVKKYRYHITDAQVCAFNEELSSALSEQVVYLNTYDVLNAAGYDTTDGLHYQNRTYKMLYEYTIDYIQGE